MKAKSAKAKGKRLEQHVAAAYRHYDIDESARPMPMSGAMSHFKGDIFKREDYQYIDECKNQERVSLWKWWEQAKSQAQGFRTPVLHISANFRPILTVIELETYMNLRKQVKDLEDLLAKAEQSAATIAATDESKTIQTVIDNN